MRESEGSRLSNSARPQMKWRASVSRNGFERPFHRPMSWITQRHSTGLVCGSQPPRKPRRNKIPRKRKPPRTGIWKSARTLPALKRNVFRSCWNSPRRREGEKCPSADGPDRSAPDNIWVWKRELTPVPARKPPCSQKPRCELSTPNPEGLRSRDAWLRANQTARFSVASSISYLAYLSSGRTVRREWKRE
jgi:hypothetical protein